ncbi:AraC family transcriptional regulator [Lachnoclostridium sp. Marseille-P6806]|uniref:AraC family transcriptional regulator n=1 Tax=Lachnoclostridium sp. Marseille-P6806 TaxID=2364793 RepID=UPI0013EEED5E|nr:AraC family transcriptional regulator [Lachnoclostridium sp. Marseille-P6806]
MKPKYADREENPVFVGEVPGLFVEEAYRSSSYAMRTRHFHDSMELYFLMEGDRLYFIEQNTCHVKPGMAILIGRNRIHKTSMYSEDPVHRRFLLQYEEEPFDALLKGLGYPGFDEFGSRFQGPAVFTEAEWGQALRIMEDLRQTLGEAGVPQPGRSRALLRAAELLGLFAHAAERGVPGEKREDRSLRGELRDGTDQRYKVDELAQYLQKHCGESHSLDALAAKFYISRSRLTVLFRQVTGFTVVEYLMFMRMRRAQELLCGTALSVTEIAAQTGFGNVTYFERVFRTMTGDRPLHYRRTHKSASAQTEDSL